MPEEQEDLTKLSVAELRERKTSIIEYLSDTVRAGFDKTVVRKELQAIEAELATR